MNKEEFSLQKPRNENHDQNQLHHFTTNNDNNKTDEDESDDDDEEIDEYEEEYEDSFKAAADALNNTRTAQQHDIIIFNRVPKVGSQSLMTLMRELGKVNNFQHFRDKGKGHETILLKPDDQRKLINEIQPLPRPFVYSQHVAFVNFTQFHMTKPIYINLVRDPVERIISWHYYIRGEWYYKTMNAMLGDKAPKRPSDEFMNMDFDNCIKTKSIYCTFNQMETKNPTGDHRRQTLFFCGQNKKLCMPFNSPAAMQKAKRTVEKEYAVVGTWEDTNITLSVLEHYIPRFFRNAKTAYHLNIERLSKVNKNKEKPPVSELSRQILRKNLTQEIEFYEFCKQRLYMQYAAISGGNGYKLDNDEYAIIPDNEEDDYDEL